jgi:hypothetical protein
MSSRDYLLPGDVYTIDPEGNLIPVEITSTPLSAPLYNLAGDPLNLRGGARISDVVGGSGGYAVEVAVHDR